MNTDWVVFSTPHRLFQVWFKIFIYYSSLLLETSLSHPLALGLSSSLTLLLQRLPQVGSVTTVVGLLV